MSMSDIDYDDEFCPVCGGEGFIIDCFDGCCLDADIGCDDCTRTCACLRPTKQPSPELQQVLAEALTAISKAVAETDSRDSSGCSPREVFADPDPAHPAGGR